MTDDDRDDLEKQRDALQTKLDEQGELEAEEVEILITLDQRLATFDGSAQVPAASEPIPAEKLFTQSVMMTMSRSLSGMTGARPIAVPSPKPDPADLKPNDLSGPRLAIANLNNGLVVRGLMEQVDPTAATLLIVPSGSAFGDPQKIPAETVRTVHLMLPTGLKKPEGLGRALTVNLKNGQRLEGHSPDYQEGCPAFSLLPKGERFIERILIYAHAVEEIQAGA